MSIFRGDVISLDITYRRYIWIISDVNDTVMEVKLKKSEVNPTTVPCIGLTGRYLATLVRTNN